ncbi:SseB family protein [Streptomyces sp. NPDC004542]|uniref:SseB family protein n=1 Tax=Streptomyces sp. NPDC004542 TaxID=3154281 RepID=UPI0033B64618
MSTPHPEGDAQADAVSAAEETQAALIDLAKSVALVPQTLPAEGEQPPEGALALPVIEQDGNRYVPVFTSDDSLAAAGADPDTAVRIPVVELAVNWPEDDLWLAVDPSTEDGIALPSDLVRALPGFAGLT